MVSANTKNVLIIIPLFLVASIAIILLGSSSTEDSTRSDIGIAFSIIGVFFAIWIAIKISQSTKSRELQEHQHYKERLTYEIPRLIFLVDLIAVLHKRMTKNEGILEKTVPDERAVEQNRAHAEKCLERLRTINSIFNIPTQIRSECDEVLSSYETFLENVEHKSLLLKSSEQLNVVYATKAKDFLNKKFFKKNTTSVIDENLKKNNDLLSQIFERSNVVVNNDSPRKE